ncbi:UDP-N-acetylmuramoyl-L-alanine--D-glutamate ligase [Paucibacter sp. PLA-PC-4]|uniref:UDP-N-acetylmuramoyl-L-alanine--D-glutamate ligase n=1 Tax=Paucibacter sp. PLA-PC-4 TaxID=2993655 RepID=UPI0022488DFE|nr:UDP-N-acetylmuramoyl-L-alanine--D-glutamate ligase [Paucibacter sp. PLA-PC-4]MCX2861294.1 UDP-N-acetylmuramoyl-L-alanine--D-glutamate ligase [Paucibacter sp. PLA-PC-4]
MKHLQGLKVLVLGLGDSGLAMAAWVRRCGGQARVWDSREVPPQLAALREQLPEVEFIHGELPESALKGVQLLLKSPGLSPLDARLMPLLNLAQGTAVPVQGELDLFARALADLKAERRYEPAVLAITGTNGKTTTTSMCAQLIERCGRRVVMAGNIGPSMLTTLGAALDLEPAAEPVQSLEPLATDADEAPDVTVAAEQTVLESIDAMLDEAPLPIKPPPPKPAVFAHLPEVWVLELSSFQLDTVQGFEPTAATVLNLTQDHLDWHGDMAAYGRAKARIFGTEVDSPTVMVINRDDALVEAMVPAPVKVQQGRGRAAKLVSRKLVRFGLDEPRHPGDFGLVQESGMSWLVRAREADETIKKKKGEDEEELLIQRLMPADALRVRGRHNAANALAALALASAAGCPLAPMLHGLREYRGEPHRVEHVGTIKGVDFYDDSKGTNVGATVAAITGLGADRAPAQLVVILGGDGKGQDFGPLREPVARHARAVALIGRDGPQIAAALQHSGVPMQAHETLQDATAWCLAQARSGDSVLLSPACASLDMFRNYGHRAEVFVDAVQGLAQEEGLSL